MNLVAWISNQKYSKDFPVGFAVFAVANGNMNGVARCPTRKIGYAKFFIILIRSFVSFVRAHINNSFQGVDMLLTFFSLSLFRSRSRCSSFAWKTTCKRYDTHIQFDVCTCVLSISVGRAISIGINDSKFSGVPIWLSAKKTHTQIIYIKWNWLSRRPIFVLFVLKINHFSLNQYSYLYVCVFLICFKFFRCFWFVVFNQTKWVWFQNHSFTNHLNIVIDASKFARFHFNGNSCV